jgi:bifunctional non-homologous end joining protein LigD
LQLKTSDMSLSKYKQKRSFAKTSEPTGGKALAKELRFVVQKHDASHLHYDFRLEMEGVLKSWAVPKGPSTDPAIKRLAMMVEDHPYDYRTFEGIIPKGQYGGGTVIVWDEGTYEAADLNGATKKEQEKCLLKELYAGKIKFILYGKKLKGEYALVKSFGRGENAWLLMKLKDSYASQEDITAKEKSVQSGKTLNQVEKTTTNVYGQTIIQPGTTKKDIKDSKKKVKTKPVKQASFEAFKNGKKSPLPKNVKPMLATLVDEPFDEEGWLYEVKWDGYRAIAILNDDKVELSSRNEKSFNGKFYPVYNALKELGLNAVLDGEIIVADNKGLSNFGNLQNWRSEADGILIYYVFDLLWLNGYSIMQLPLAERRDLLRTIIPGNNEFIKLSENFNATGTEFFKLAEQTGLEGIIAKKAASTYSPGIRSKEWLKIKTSKRQEVVIGGFTKNDGTLKQFSSLLVGVYEKDKLIYTGKIGTGFNEKMQSSMMKQFKPLITSIIPFENEPDVNKPSRFRPNPPHAKAVWLKPKLVCEVSFREMTTDGVMRHPSFEGMREDKNAKAVILEKEKSTKNIVKKPTALNKNKMIMAPKNKSKTTLLNPTDETQTRAIDGHEIKFTNLSKIFWPKEKYTKRDMINYYYQVASFMLPYMKDRPQSLNRHPNGITGQGFYQKDVTGKVPDWIKTFPYHTDNSEEERNFLVCTDEASLLYIASLGCIEMNPWNSRIQKPDNPDWCIIDLDPDKNTFDQVIEAAQVTKKILDAIKVPCVCKTSGSTGLHIYIPLGAKYSYEQSKEFARIIVKLVHDEIPKFTSLERITAKRNGKMYLDFLQNRPQATIAAPYSIRPKPGATVSTPLHWDEVKKGLAMKDFTIKNVPGRLKIEGDLFKPAIEKGINLKQVISEIEKQFNK